MEPTTEPTTVDSGKNNLDSPPAYFDVVHNCSDTEYSILKLESPVTSPALSEGESPLMDKMVHLETLCSSMHTMLEFQNSTYFDVKSQLSEINKSIHKDTNSPRNSRIKQRLSMVLGTGDDCFDEQISSEPSVQPETSECDDLGYDRVCNMLEHLLSDAKIAIEKAPDVSETNDCEDETAGEVRPAPRKKLSPFARKKSNTISTVKKQPTELQSWHQFLQNDLPYEARRRLILPGFRSEGIERRNQSPLFEKPFKDQPVVFAMIYWTLCFTLGVLLLDRYLVELASRQVTLAMQSILPDDFTNPPVSEFDEDSRQHRKQGQRARRYSM